MEQKKGIFQGWGVLEIGLVAVILVLCLAAGGLGVAALAGFELFGSNQAGEVAGTDGTQPADSSDGIQAAATPTIAPTVPGQEDAAGSSSDTDATIELSNSTASPGSTVTVIGNGWPANSRVVISLVPSDPPAYAVNSVIVQTDGTFSVEFIVPSDGRWLQESPVPVVAEAVDMNITAQASLTIVSVTDGSPAVTPVAVGIIVVGKVVVTPQPPPPAGAAQLTATANVNVRTGPGTSYDIVGVLLAGQTAEITGRNADATWWQIKFPGTPGGLGWVSAAYSSAQNIGNVPVVAAPPPPPPPPPTPTPQPGIEIKGWLGEYFNNKDLAGPPALVRDDPSISFDWGLGSPAPEIPVDYFSVRWTRDIYFPAGTYRFYTRTDDGTRLFIDGALLINQWNIQSPTTYAADVYLAEGNHRIQMDYFEETLGAMAILSWQRADYSADWRAEYYTNQNLQGNPALVRNEPSVSYNWGLGSPAPGIIPEDHWSARWARTVYLENGDYTMQLRSKDGVRFWFDENLVLDRWTDGDTGQLTYNQNIPSGYHTLRLEFYNNVAEAFISFSYYRQDVQATPPTAIINAPSEGTVGVPVTFNGDRSKSGSSSISKYEWDFGDGKKATGKKVNYTYSDDNTYKVKLKVIDENGLSDSTSQNIKINNNPTDTTPPVAVIQISPNPGETGSPSSFNGSGSYSLSPITNYQWDFGDGTQATGVTVNHTYNNDGTYNVSLTVVAQNNLRSTSRYQYQVDDPLTPSEKPIAVIVAPDNGQTNQDLLFDGSQSTPSNNLASYAWNFGDGSVANAIKVNKSYDKAGIWITTLTVTDNLGQQNTTQHTTNVTGTPPPNPQPSFTFSPNSPTEGETVDFNGSVISAKPITKWSWDFGDSSTPGDGQNVTTIYSTAGTYNVTLTVEDEDGTTGSASQDITVQSFVPPQPPPQPIISGPDSAVVSQTVTFKAAIPLKTSSITNFQWKFGDGTTGPDAPEVSHVYTTDGAFTVELVLVDDRGQSSQPGTHDISVTAPQVQPLPGNDVPPQAVISAPPSGTVNQPVPFDASNSVPGTNPITSIEWDFGDGKTDSGNVLADHTYDTAGTYTAQLTLTDDQGVSSTDQHQVVIADAAALVPIQPTTPPVVNEPVAVFNVDPNPATVGQDVTFDGGFSYGDNPIVEYNWDFGDGTTDTGMGVTHVYAQAGNYAVTVTVVDDQGLSDTAPPVYVDVQAGAAILPAPLPPTEPDQPQPQPEPQPQPQPQPEPQPVPDPPSAAFDFAPNPAAAGQPVQFDGGFSHGQIVQWTWDFGDGDATQSDTGMGVTHVYAVEGEYQVTLTVTDDAGQTDSYSQMVPMQPAPQVEPAPQPEAKPAPAPAPVEPAPAPAPQQQAAPAEPEASPDDSSGQSGDAPAQDDSNTQDTQQSN